MQLWSGLRGGAVSARVRTDEETRLSKITVQAKDRAPEAQAAQAAQAALPRSKEDLRAFILERACFDARENERIFEKWFRDAPRYLFRVVDRKYGLARGTLCDVGCSYGMNLLFCAPGSYGIEVESKPVAFARSLRLTAYQRDFVQDDISDLPAVDAVWCAALLEHVDSPHVCLRKLHRLLKPGGLLGLYVPIIPRFHRLGLDRIPLLGRYFTGYQASDHVNAFTRATLAFFCERAGFRTLEVSPFYPGLLRILSHVVPFSEMVAGTVYVGRAIPDWEYPPRACRRVAANAQGFVRRAVS